MIAWKRRRAARMRSPRRLPGGVIQLLVLALLLPLAVAPASAQPAGWPSADDLVEACEQEEEHNPWLATVCYPRVIDQAQPNGNAAAVVLFRDTPADNPQIVVASYGQVGAVYGLAFSRPRHALYVAAYQKRGVRQARGAGTIFRIDLATGAVLPVITVPDAGRDLHSGAGDQDQAGRDLVGKVGLGDIDLDDAQETLYAMNLADRRIYRYRLSDHRQLGSFAHGAAGEDWAAEARPFGLRVHQGRVFHGLVRSGERGGSPAELEARVYSSLPDGGDMRLEAAWPLDYVRGVARIATTVQLSEPTVEVPLEWLPWRDGEQILREGDVQTALYPQPIVADLELGARGQLVVGLRDRRGDMSIGWQYQAGGRILKPGLGLGDILRADAGAPGAGWQLQVEPEPYYDRTSLADESAVGGLARLPLRDQVVAAAVYNLDPSLPAPEQIVGGAVWYANAADGLGRAGQRRGVEAVCAGTRVYTPVQPFGTTRSGRSLGPRLPDGLFNARPAGLLHSEWQPARTIGDVEALCGPAPVGPPPSPPPPSATPTRTPTPTPTNTPSPSATPTVTPTPTPARIYLPIAIEDRCDPTVRRADVVLVLDASTSMLDPTRAGRSKVEAAVEAAGRFLDRMAFPADRAAVVTFNADAAVLQPLTGDEAQLRAALARIENVELTRIHLGISAAQSLIERTPREADTTPTIILLTDGRSNPDPVQRAIEAATLAKAAGTVIFTIGLGEDVEREALREIASRPDFFRYAPDGEDLGEVYERIAGEIPCPPSAYWPFPGARP